MCYLIQISKLIKKENDDLEKELKDAGFIEPDTTVNKINSLENDLTDLLKDEKDLFVDKISNDDSLPDVLSLLEKAKDNDDFKIAVASLFKEKFEDFTSYFADAYIKTIDKEMAFEMFTDRTTAWISDWSDELGDLMQLTSHNEIDRILSKALAEGSSVQSVTEELQDSYKFSRARARTTAITEMLTSHSVAKNEAFVQSPAVTAKKWKHSGVAKIKPRPEHVALDGTIVSKNEYFNVGGELALYPRDTSLSPGQRILCHCTHTAVVDPEILNLTLEQKKKLQTQNIVSNNIAFELTK